MSRIKHANVVCYFESFVEDGSLHIAMEYCDGALDPSPLLPPLACSSEPSKQCGVMTLFYPAAGGSLQRQWKKAQEANVHFSEEQILYWTAQIVSALK
jgi:serine/threonine protein kinase